MSDTEREYTPTTEEVREKWGWRRGLGPGQVIADAEFDRWLAKVRADELREIIANRQEWQAEMYQEDDRQYVGGSAHGAGVDVLADVIEGWVEARIARAGG